MTRQYVSYSDPTNSIPIVLLGSMASSGGIRMDLMAGSIWASGWLRCCGWYPVWWDAGENEVILRVAGRHPPWGLSTADSRLQVWGTGLPFGAVRDASTQPKLCEDSFTNTFYRVILVLRRLHHVGRQESA